MKVVCKRGSPTYSNVSKIIFRKRGITIYWKDGTKVFHIYENVHKIVENKELQKMREAFIKENPNIEKLGENKSQWVHDMRIHGLSFQWDYKPNTPQDFLEGLVEVIEKVEGRKVIITNYVTTGKLIISSIAANNPYDFQSFRRYVAWINSRFPQIPNGAWVIKTIGLSYGEGD